MWQWHSCSRVWQRDKSRRLDRWFDRWLDIPIQAATWLLNIRRVIHTNFVWTLFSLAPAVLRVLSWLVQALLFETTNSWGVMWRHWPNSSLESTEKKSPLDRLSLLTWLGHSDTYIHSTCRFISKRSVVRGWLPLSEINASTVICKILCSVSRDEKKHHADWMALRR